MFRPFTISYAMCRALKFYLRILRWESSVQIKSFASESVWFDVLSLRLIKCLHFASSFSQYTQMEESGWDDGTCLLLICYEASSCQVHIFHVNRFFINPAGTENSLYPLKIPFTPQSQSSLHRCFVNFTWQNDSLWHGELQNPQLWVMWPHLALQNPHPWVITSFWVTLGKAPLSFSKTRRATPHKSFPYSK